MTNFIEVYENISPEGFSKHMCEAIDKLQECGLGHDRQSGEGAAKHKKDDYQVNFNNDMPFELFTDTDGETWNTMQVMSGAIQTCFDQYAEKYSYLKDMDLRSHWVKGQKTGSGQGYHVWHAEQGGGWVANRVLVWIWYLNDLPAEARGETEFLHQQKLVKPQENMMVMWPAAFTHLHRGNPVYGHNYKYVLTGWFSVV
tara:strand:+ start:1242 stop:1838 length:597 start_codon:yes stop_codon:yes gene_type:complete